MSETRKYKMKSYKDKNYYRYDKEYIWNVARK